MNLSSLFSCLNKPLELAYVFLKFLFHHSVNQAQVLEQHSHEW